MGLGRLLEVAEETGSETSCFFWLTVFRLDFTSIGTLAAGAMSNKLGS